MNCCICNDDIWQEEKSVIVGDGLEDVAHKKCADEQGEGGEQE